MNKLLRYITLAALAAVISSCASVDPATTDPLVVAAPAGAVRGQAEGQVRVFRGIPYAQPPVGAARWQPPRPMPAWKGVREATAYGNGCVVPTVWPVGLYTPDERPPTGEDCLTLNIWSPANASKGAEKAPVFFWIHGGALWAGTSREPLYEAEQLARSGIVVVSINYRLGPLGWLAHPQLSAESTKGISGNYGLQDQVLALQWVRDNIAAFGGDAGNVTIAGESAGALSVIYLMASPPARGLFARAISQSGYLIAASELKQDRPGVPSAENLGLNLAKALGEADLAALRGMDAQELTNAAAKSGFSPFGNIDGHWLPRQVLDVFDRGEQAPVPILVGFNSGEIRSLRFLAPPPPDSVAKYKSQVKERYRDLADAYLRLYPAKDIQESILAVTRDAIYGWTSQRLADHQTRLGAASYLYFFDHGYPAADTAGLHAFHASELPYVFGTFNGTPPRWPKVPENETERRYSNAMMDYWTSFVRGGKPEADGAPAWPAYDSQGAYMHFGEQPKAAPALMPGMYGLHESAICRRRAGGDGAWNWNRGFASPPLPDPVAACTEQQERQ